MQKHTELEERAYLDLMPEVRRKMIVMLIYIYIERGRLKSLIQYFAFIDELENALDRHVDVVTTGIEDKTFLFKIMQEGVLLYEE